MDVRKYFSEENKLHIINAIRIAESHTSGEIRVHIEKYCKENELDRAAYIFKKLEMYKTKLRNSVLFYMAVKDQKFAIIGDIGINQKVNEGYWVEIKEIMAEKFKNGKYTDGLSAGIRKAGEQLKQFFPVQDDDINELPDEISFGID